MLHRKSLGAYYTPPALASAMSTWAIREGTEHVLEPSFGGCCFLDSTRQRLKTIGVSKPYSRLYGADIDPSAFIHLKKRCSEKHFHRRFLQGDFLALNNSDFLRSHFEVIIGNPPFVAHSSLTLEQKTLYRATATRLGFPIKGKPSLWAYFLVVSLKYAKKDGRIAWVLPWSFIGSEYGKEVQTYIARHFKNALVFAIEEELFLSEGTKERTVILLADGYSQTKRSSKTLNVEYCSSFDQFLHRIPTNGQTPHRETTIIPKTDKPEHTKVHKKLHASILSKKLVPLGDLMILSIGVVTGDMKTFTCTLANTISLKLDKTTFQRCLTRSAYAQGILFNQHDLDQLEKNNKPSCLLTIPASHIFSTSLKDHFSSRCSTETIINNSTFQKRYPWYSIPRSPAPDAFFRFFSQQRPLLIINRVSAQGTNSLYTASLRNTVSQQERLKLLASISLSTLSCLGGAHAELASTRYGNGAMKMSLDSVRKLPVIVSPTELYQYTLRCLSKADSLIRYNKPKEAAKVADEWLSHISGNRITVSQLSKGAMRLREMRTGQGR